MTPQLLAEVYCLPETAAEPFTADLKLALAEVSGVVFFAARSAKAEGQGEPKQLGAERPPYLCHQVGFVSRQCRGIFPGQPTSDG